VDSVDTTSPCEPKASPDKSNPRVKSKSNHHRTARIPPPYLSFTLRILISEALAFSSLTCHESSLPKGQNSLFLSLNKVTNPNFKTNPFISQMGSKRSSHLDDPPTASSSKEEEEETLSEEEETSSEEEEAAPKISSLPSTPVTDKKPQPKNPDPAPVLPSSSSSLYIWVLADQSFFNLLQVEVS
jgi:hypothetical protein